MTSQSAPSHPPDICVLLHAHGEQRWLFSEVVPVLRQLEQPACLPEDQRGAAIAYLEVLWLDAQLRAADTDAAHAKLEAAHANGDRLLHEKAHRYHATVHRERGAIAQRIAALARSDHHAAAPQHAGF
ncbi:MAG TPA: hypothetical protein VFY36_10250 [Solirubrobacteraceae bacterium]|nr:hypothetical protein [Solirubrobacteraceae bacterium]